MRKVDAAGQDGSWLVGRRHLRRRSWGCQTSRACTRFAFSSESTSLGMLAAATEQSATRRAPFSGTTKTPCSFIFAAAARASSTNIVTKKPPS